MAVARQVIFNIFAAIFALAVSGVVPSSQNYWIVISTLLAMQMSLAVTQKRKFGELFVLGLLTAMLAFFASLLVQFVFVLAFFLAGVVFAVMWVSKREVGGANTAFLVGFSVVLSAGLPGVFAIGVERFFCILLGFFIAIVLRCMPWVNDFSVEAKKAVADCLDSLSQLAQVIFSSYTATNYKERSYDFEKLLHDKRSHFLYAISQARLTVAQAPVGKRENFVTTLLTLDHLYEILLALGGLLYRVEDHATFSVASQEFVSVAQAIVASLQTLSEELAGRQCPDLAEVLLLEKIQQFEEMNQGTLQVVAREPIVFMLFTHDLRALFAGIQILANSLALVRQYD